MRILAGGNVGIGNTAPIAPLTIGNGSLANNDGFIVLEKCTTVGTSRQFRIGLNTNFELVMGDYGAGNVAATWQETLRISNTAPANVLVIDNNGYVGIGNTPAYKLDVNGDVYAGNNSFFLSTFSGTGNSQFFGKKLSTTIVAGMEIQNTTLGGNYSQKLHFHTHTYGGLYGRRMTISEGGNIGIGTDVDIQSKLIINPIVSDRNSFDHSEAPLTITQPTATSTTVLNDPKSVLHLCRQGTSGQAQGARATFKLCRYENSGVNSRSRLDLLLSHNSYDETASVSFRSDGNVGIGTTSPSDRLHVSGGNILSTGDVIAYFSDERLKNIKSYIKDVLPTLDEINVFKYNSNDLGESFGYNKDKDEIGLSAQEIQKHYPELINLAPFDTMYDSTTNKKISKSGENYLTLNYNRLVPILLQGIKELNNKNKNIENELRELKEKYTNIVEELRELKTLILNR